MIHITENSLRRIARQPTLNMARVRACDPRGHGNYETEFDNVVIVNESLPRQRALLLSEGGHLDGIARVDCPTCRALLDVALEQLDVAAAIRMVAP